MGQYIPDITERFPEGFGGVDMTDRYLTDWRDWRGLNSLSYCEIMDAMENEDYLPWADEEEREEN